MYAGIFYRSLLTNRAGCGCNIIEGAMNCLIFASHSHSGRPVLHQSWTIKHYAKYFLPPAPRLTRPGLPGPYITCECTLTPMKTFHFVSADIGQAPCFSSELVASRLCAHAVQPSSGKSHYNSLTSRPPSHQGSPQSPWDTAPCSQEPWPPVSPLCRLWQCQLTRIYPITVHTRQYAGLPWSYII